MGQFVLALMLGLCTAVLTTGDPVRAEPLVTAERVTGIGGFFFRSKDPRGLARWYENNLGVTRTPTDYHQEPWRQAAGPTVFEPFPFDAKLFERKEQQFVLNFRVRNLDKLAAQLRRANIVVQVDPKTYPNGRFALTHDPEGNPIQLWQETR